MGLADILFEELESTVVRSTIGDRTFNNSFENSQQDEGGLLSWIWNGASRLVGFLAAEAGKFISFSLTGLWSLFVSTSQFIWNFNWNMTDTEIDKQIQQRWNALAGMLGGTLGNAFDQSNSGPVTHKIRVSDSGR